MSRGTESALCELLSALNRRGLVRSHDVRLVSLACSTYTTTNEHDPVISTFLGYSRESLVGLDTIVSGLQLSRIYGQLGGQANQSL